MTGLPLLFLLLHIGAAIIAFGPTFAFSVIGSMGAAEPLHSNFALRVNERISTRMVIPLAIFLGITGIGLIWTVPIDLTKAIWLDVGIVLYVITLGIALGFQQPAVRQLIEATRNPPPALPAGSAGGDPPAHIAALSRRILIGGISLTVLIVTIIILMVLGSNGFFA